MTERSTRRMKIVPLPLHSTQPVPEQLTEIRSQMNTLIAVVEEMRDALGPIKDNNRSFQRVVWGAAGIGSLMCLVASGVGLYAGLQSIGLVP